MNYVKHLTEKFFRTTTMPFDKKTPILYYDPKSTARWSTRKYLLYPVRMYRVVAPLVSFNKINILEKAVLGIFHAGITENIEIASHLDIDKDLAALIATQLADRYYVDLRGELTESGREILKNETSMVQNSSVGFIFQDPWTGDLFPRFVERENYTDVRFKESGFPELSLGTTGKPIYQSAFMPQRVENTIERQPSPIEVINAVRQHHRTSRNVRRMNKDNDDDDWSFDRIPALDRVNFIEEEPRDLWLATFIYVPEDISSPNPWNICDPFGLGDSPWLFDKLEKRRKDRTILGLEQFLLQMIGDRRKEQFDKFNDRLTLLDREARLIVERKLSPVIRKWEDLFEDLVALERSHIEAEELTDSKILLDKLENIVTKSQKAAERLLKMLQQDFPTRGVANRLSGNRNLNHQTLNNYAKNAGFQEPLPPKLLNIDRTSICRAADCGYGSLRALILAALLATPNHSAHPLRLLAPQSPNLLHLLDELAEGRNAATHASDPQDTAQPLKLVDLAPQVDAVYRLVAGALQLSYQQ